MLRQHFYLHPVYISVFQKNYEASVLYLMCVLLLQGEVEPISHRHTTAASPPTPLACPHPMAAV